MLRLVKVAGNSMSPALADGDYVLTIKPWSPRPGFIYLVEHTDLGRILKRLERVDAGRFYFTGDNAKSTPSSVIGPVTRDRIVGRIIMKLKNR